MRHGWHVGTWMGMVMAGCTGLGKQVGAVRMDTSGPVLPYHGSSVCARQDDPMARAFWGWKKSVWRILGGTEPRTARPCLMLGVRARIEAW